jgi:ATP-dependent DNA ligase
MKPYKKLYKLNSNGKSTQVWEIYISKDDRSYYTSSGQVGGKMTTSAPTFVEPKAKRTQREQIVLAVESKITIKQRGKYVGNKKNVGAKADAALPGYSAMLAHKWEERKQHIKFPCMAQPKLDGIRCVATKDGLFYRSRIPIVSCAHVSKDLVAFFKKFPDARLDGELYTHELKDMFENIVRAVRKSPENSSPEELELQAKVEYHLYDAPRLSGLTEEDSFERRYAMMSKLARGGRSRPSIHIVHTRICETEKELMGAHKYFLSLGYEGTIVRNRDMAYKGSRSSELLKLKDFDDSEFEVIKIEEGVGNLVGHAATFTLVMENGTQFRAKPSGTHKKLIWMWKNPGKIIGKMCTVTYKGMTNARKVPRHPSAGAIRGLKDRSDWV